MATGTAPALLLVSAPRGNGRPASFWRFEGSPPPRAGKTPILALGGLGLDGRSFARLAPLAAERDLVLANLPNELPRGARMEDLARDSLATLDAAGHTGRAAVVVGSSLGGMVALAAALESPARVAALVLVGSGAAWSDLPAKLRAASRLVPLVPRRPFPSILAGFLAPPGKHPTLEIGRELRTQMLHRTKEYAHGLLGAARAFDARPRLPGLRVPALVVHGAGDRVFPARAGAALAAGIPGAVHRVVPACGHLPHVTDAPGFLGILGAFLAEKGL